jgi:hypothetical protein
VFVHYRLALSAAILITIGAGWRGKNYYRLGRGGEPSGPPPGQSTAT